MFIPLIEYLPNYILMLRIPSFLKQRQPPCPRRRCRLPAPSTLQVSMLPCPSVIHYLIYYLPLCEYHYHKADINHGMVSVHKLKLLGPPWRISTETTIILFRESPSNAAAHTIQLLY